MSSIIPNRIKVDQNYPNPFNPTTNIKYKLYREEFVKVTDDILGNIVNNLLNTRQAYGYHLLQWDATNNHGRKVPAGMYFYRIEAGDFKNTIDSNIKYTFLGFFAL